MALESAALMSAPIPTDERLPQLALALDLERMAPLLPRGRSWRIAYLRYKPATSCVVLYEAPGPQWIYAKLFAEDADERVMGRTYFPGHRLALVPFREDLAIAGLARAGSEDLMRRTVSEKRRGLFAPGWGCWTPVRYKPERRAVLCGAHEKGRYYGRFYAGREGAAAAAWHRYFARLDQPTPIPGCLGYSHTYRTLLIRELSGEPLRNLLADGDALDAAARLLAGWRRLPPPPDAPRLDASSIAPAAAAIDRLLGDHGASELARELIATAPAAGRSALLHGDFYADQVLIEGDRARLLDLDRLATGDPHHDLATFCAHVHAEAPERAVSICARFLEAYAGAAGEAVSQPRLDWHFSASMLRLAELPFRRFEPDWPGRVHALLESARRKPC